MVCAHLVGASHVACPPRLKPAKSHSPMVRSSFGNKYAGRISMRKETAGDVLCLVPYLNNCRRALKIMDLGMVIYGATKKSRIRCSEAKRVWGLTGEMKKRGEILVHSGSEFMCYITCTGNPRVQVRIRTSQSQSARNTYRQGRLRRLGGTLPTMSLVLYIS